MIPEIILLILSTIFLGVAIWEHEVFGIVISSGVDLVLIYWIITDLVKGEKPRTSAPNKEESKSVDSIEERNNQEVTE